MRYLRTKMGMTLVEVMVSVMLITLLAGSILAVLIENIKLGETLEYNYAAVNIAKSEMDRIRELRRDSGYAVLSTIAGESVSVVALDTNGDGISEANFTRTTTINTAFSTNLTEVTVSVSYKRTGDVNATVVTLKSLLSPYF